MIDYLKYLEENLGIDIKDTVKEDMLLSMILYDEQDDDVSVYDLIAGYLSLCEEEREEYNELFSDIECCTPDSKIGILMKSMIIKNVMKNDDKYTFEISAEIPVPFSIRLELEENSYNNEKDSIYVLEKEEGDSSDYELSIDSAYKDDVRAVVIAGLFNKYVDLDSLYNLLEKMYTVNSKLIYTAHTDRNLPISVELSKEGCVNLYYSGGNNCEDIMGLQPDRNLVFSNSSEVGYSKDFLRNFYHWHKNDPIWVLKHIYVNKKDITSEDLLAQFDEDTDILDEIFKKSGYENSLSYRDMYYEDQTLYYVYGKNNELIEIKDYKFVYELDTYYKFTFEDDSSVSYPKDKIVVVVEDADANRYYHSDAVKSLNLI